jgi:hypothetical protein
MSTRATRAILALVGPAAVVAGIVLLPTGPGSAQALAAQTSPHPAASSSTGPPRPDPSRKPPAKHVHHAGTTVTGPRLWDPVHNRLFASHSTVTVSQTTNLTNQFIQVTWKGFTPSGPPGVPGVYNQDLTTYPVMVAQCNTIKPKYWGQCYGSNAGGIPGDGPYGPMNTAYATTSANGTGQADIQILAAAQNQFLGCGKQHRCSLVIVPAQGGNPPSCSDHSLDSLNALGAYDFGGQYGQCSWQDRIVVPLSFVRAPRFCAIRNASLTVLGSPMLNLAMQQWIGALCAGSNPLALTYNPTITEPEAIQDLGTGLGDVALTTRPGPTRIGKRTYTFAPVAVSGVAIAYWVDSPTTFQPVTNLKLDPRLVAKLLTLSYNFDGDACGTGPPRAGIGCDNAIDGNPSTLFADPEFKQLNRHVQMPFSATFQVPTVMSGHSDMTWEITRWIADNAPASGFLRGQFDPWGMHVNTDYLGLKYPVDSFTGQDNYPVIAHKYSPAFPLSFVVGLQAQNTDNGTDYNIDPTTGNYPKDPIEFPGVRSLFAVIDEGDAAAFRFPVARLLNAAGRYVAPTAASMAAALSSLTPTGGNRITEQVDFAKQKANAYPLTMVIYAMVPTSDISATKAAAIARFLDFVAGPGQVRGLNVGQLPPGYLPLPASLRAQTLRAANAVRNRTGNPRPRPRPSPSSSRTASPSASPSASASPSPPAPSPGVGQGIVTVALKSAPTAGLTRYALPVLLIFGGLTALGGASSMIVSAGGAAIAARLRRIRRVRPNRLHLGLRRKQ